MRGQSTKSTLKVENLIPGMAWNQDTVYSNRSCANFTIAAKDVFTWTTACTIDEVCDVSTVLSAVYSAVCCSIFSLFRWRWWYWARTLTSTQTRLTVNLIHLIWDAISIPIWITIPRSTNGLGMVIHIGIEKTFLEPGHQSCKHSPYRGMYL